MFDDTVLTVRLVGSATVVKGQRVPGTPGTSFTISGSLQPAKGSELIAFPEEIRKTIEYKIYTESVISENHQVQIDGIWFNVFKSLPYKNKVIDHNKYFLSQVNS